MVSLARGMAVTFAQKKAERLVAQQQEQVRVLYGEGENVAAASHVLTWQVTDVGAVAHSVRGSASSAITQICLPCKSGAP